jgi:polysaccharide export outer membrane protein
MTTLWRACPLLGLLLCSLLAGSAAAQAPPAAPASPGSTEEDYRIGPEDQLSIVVWKNETLSRVVVVRPDGKISLPLINDVQAAGRTAMELKEDLTQRLSAFMPSPEVSVIVNEVRSFHISVLGEVQKPGRYDLRSRTTVLEAIALAGGFKDFASPSKIVILRGRGKNMRRIPFNYNKAVTSSGGEVDNLDLMPNDIILVP